MTLRRRFWSSKKGQGEGIRFLLANVNYDGADCLIWPLGKDYHGYGIVGVEGRIRKASRVMCELVNGPPPTPKHESAHSCGRGNQGCVHPKHLSWKTRTENQRDRVQHGTAGKGASAHIKYKLTPELVAEIRSIGSSMTKAALGRKFNCTPANIAKILDGRTWPNGIYEKGGFAKTPYRGGSRKRIVDGEKEPSR